MSLVTISVEHQLRRHGHQYIPKPARTIAAGPSTRRIGALAPPIAIVTVALRVGLAQLDKHVSFVKSRLRWGTRTQVAKAEDVGLAAGQRNV